MRKCKICDIELTDKNWVAPKQLKCKPCRAVETRRYYAANPEVWRARNERKKAYDKVNKKQSYQKHHLDFEDFEKLRDKYNGKCWVCKDRTATVIDHDHDCCPSVYSCGACVRGYLCHHCNTALGLLRDNIEVLEYAIAYLK